MSRHSLRYLVLILLALAAACDEENSDWGQAPPDVRTLTIEDGATQVSVPIVNRNSSLSAVNSTEISAQFTDVEAQNAQDFVVTIKIRLGVIETELVSAKDSDDPDLTITDDGDGNYTATYDYDPDTGQDTGAYDVQFEVARGSENAVDEYTNNQDLLTLVDNFAPTLVTGTTAADPDQVDVDDVGEETTLSAAFADLDEPAVNTFRVTCRIKKGTDAAIDVVVGGQDGVSGVDITGSNGQYTFSITFNPSNSAPVGSYSLYFEVKDLSGGGGAGIAIDDYANNPDELELLP